MSVRHAYGVLAEATQAIGFGIASANRKVTAFPVDGVDGGHFQKPRCLIHNKVVLIHDDRGIIRAEIELSGSVVIRLGVIRGNLVSVTIADDATFRPASGIGAFARRRFMASAGATARAIHAVHAAAARRNAVRIGATARQLAMLASAALIAKDAAVLRHAPAV